MGKKPRKIYRPFDDDDDDAPGFPFFGMNEDDDDAGEGTSPEDILPGFNDIFKNLMKQFKSKDFMNFSKNLFKQMGLPDPAGEQGDPNAPKKGRIDVKGPFVYGFSVKFDENGKPIIDKFGNIKAPAFVPAAEPDEEGDASPGASTAMVREPIADIIEEDGEILVVVELPGVQKEDIKLDATEFSLEISALAPPVADTTTPRKYQKRLTLPAKINPDVAKARYTNGILEVRLQKVGQKPPKTANIPIE